MNKRRSFKPELKAKIVLEVLTGAKSTAQVCREHSIKEQLVTRWKKQFLRSASLIFQQEQHQDSQLDRIAELERMVGRLTIELEVAKKASQLLSLPSSRNGRS
jgi:transposase-like protein